MTYKEKLIKKYEKKLKSVETSNDFIREEPTAISKYDLLKEIVRDLRGINK